MTYKQGSFADSTTGVATMIGLLHSDLIANGWTREETNLDSGAFRWEVYKNPASNNSLGSDFYIGLSRYWASGTAGSGTVSTSFVVTIFEQWNGTLKRATNYPVWGAGPSGFTSQFLPAAAVTPRALPAVTAALPISAINVISPGSGYTSPPTVNLSVGWQGSGATFTVVMELDTVVVLAGGTGYPINETALACDVTGGGGDGSAVVTATTNGSGVVTGYTIVNRGSGFTSLPTITPTGGGSSATTTVRLRVKSVTVTNGGTLFNGGATMTFSASSFGATATGSVSVDSGFAYASMPVGSTSTQYFYTVTNEMLAFTWRRDGTAETGGWYLGTYEPLQSADYDPFPIVCCNLYSSTTTQILPTDGYGFFIREPRRSPQGGPNANLRFDLAASPQGGGNMSSGGGLFQPMPGNSTDGYSGLPFVSRCTVSGRGYYSAWRGLLKNVVVSGTNGTQVTGDGIYWTIGVTTYFATRAGANTFIVQV